MFGSKGSNIEPITPDALYTANHGIRKRPVLPPIVCNRDRNVVTNVRKFIDNELEKVHCQKQESSAERFAIYSEALNQIINNVTVYKDILADVKREHEECIATIKNGQKESLFLQNKIKTLSNIPTTIVGYSRRKTDLEEKLAILESDNRKLEEELESLTRSEEDEEIDEEPRLVETPQEKDDQRPIPGLSVEEWTNEKFMQDLLVKLDNGIEDIVRKQKTSYVPLSKKLEIDAILEERIAARNEFLEEGKSLRRSNAVLKVALDAVQDFDSTEKYKDKDLGEYLIRVLQSENHLERRSSITSLTQSAHEEDDPSKEKEAETILEYIDKFNELFSEELYNQAAVHAANSPRGVLRSIETMDRFKEASTNYPDTPTPLLMYAEALMRSSIAQDHVAIPEMSIVLARCALTENRPDLVEHWVINGCITPCIEVAHDLVEYSDKNPQHQAVCLYVAQSIFTEIQSHMDVCVSMFKLGHLGGLVDYAKNTGHFTRSEYLKLIGLCPNSSLVWNLCRPSEELTSGPEDRREDPNLPIYQRYALPLRVDQSVLALISSSEVARKIALNLLDDLHQGGTEEKGTNENLFQIVFEETNGEIPQDDTDDWSSIAQFCLSNQMAETALEIEASRIVKITTTKALHVIAQDEKEQFDYYT